MIRGEGHISILQGAILIYTVLAAGLYIQYPHFLVEVGGPGAWQVALMLTAVAVLLFLPAAGLVRRFPGLGLAEILEQVAGPYVGSLLSLVLIAWLIAALSTTIRLFSETVIIALLPQTPPSVLIITILLCVAYTSHRGLESLARAGEILLPLIAAGSFLVLLMNLPRVDTSRLYPFWGYGLMNTLSGSLYYASMGAEALILLAFGHAFRDHRTLRASGLIGLLLFGVTAAVTVAVLVMVFGAPDAAQQAFPMFNLARLIHMGRFLQRTESLIVMFWFFAAAIRLSGLFHATITIAAGSLRLPYTRPLILPMAILVMTFAILPEDFTTVIHLDREWVRPMGHGVMALPLLLLLLAMLRRKGGMEHAA